MSHTLRGRESSAQYRRAVRQGRKAIRTAQSEQAEIAEREERNRIARLWERSIDFFGVDRETKGDTDGKA